jgi:hypothetical protein
MIKRVYFGDGPKYSKVLEYYDSNNKDFYSMIEHYDFDMSDPLFPDGKGSHGIVFFQANNPYQYTKEEISVEGIFTFHKYYFIENNVKNLENEIMVSLGAKRIVNVQEIYKKGNKLNASISDSIMYYNDDQEIIKVVSNYNPSDDSISSVEEYYSLPDLPYSKGRPWKRFTTYYPNTDGCLREERINYHDDLSVVNCMYDPKLTDTGYTRIITFYKGKHVTREVEYYDLNLYQGKVFFINKLVDEDETITSIQFYDKNEKEIFE